tara:strand:+ start:1273 stop:3507 length:2235 start_codon:yes stop_codon:yes gene_type:complete
MDNNTPSINSHVTKETEIDLGTIVNVLKAHKWLLCIAVCIGLIIGFFASKNVTPHYQSSALIQVNDSVSSSSVLGNLSAFSGGVSKASPAEVQTALIQSRYVLDPLIKKQALNIQATPNYFPIIGRFLSTKKDQLTVTKPRFGLSQYAWGGEEIKVSRLNVDSKIFDHHPLTLIAGNSGHFKLYDQNDNFILAGTTGILATSKRYPDTSILVSKLRSRPFERFRVQLISIQQVEDNIRKGLSITDAGQSSSNGKLDTGILNISLKWPNKEQLPLILNDLVDIAQKQNIQQKSQNAAQQLTFVEQQIPTLKQDLTTAAKALNDYKSQKGLLDISTEGQALLQQQANLSQQEINLELRKKYLLKYFTPSHPNIVNTNQQISDLQQQQSLINKKIKQLPHMDQKAMALLLDLDVKKKLYAQLLGRAQQLSVIKAGTVGDVKILSQSTVPQIPLPMHKTMIILSSALGFFLLTAMLFLIKHLLFSGVTDPEELEAQLGISVNAVVPFSKKQAKFNQNCEKGDDEILALASPKDTAIESLRSLRTTLKLEMAQLDQTPIINVMGASPNIGKSFISLNLACVFAETKLKVCLIDADMRKGRLHNRTSLNKSPGLSDLLQSNTETTDAIQKTAFENLDCITCGKTPSNPAELLSTPELESRLAELKQQYDLILIDTPPIMAVTDACIIGQHTDINLFTVGLGKNSLREVSTTLKRLSKNRINCFGIVCNYHKKEVMYYGNNKYDYYYYSYK